MKLLIKCVEGFKDGMVHPEPVSVGETLVVDELKWKKIQQSAPGAFELLGKVVPKSSRSKKTKVEPFEVPEADLEAAGTGVVPREKPSLVEKLTGKGKKAKEAPKDVDPEDKPDAKE